MFKYRYAITYRLVVNKRYSGNPCVITATVSKPLDDPQEQAKVLKVLCVAHRVNPESIKIENYTLIERLFMPVEWVREKLNKVSDSILELRICMAIWWAKKCRS